jgi:hypothetical protein
MTKNTKSDARKVLATLNAFGPPEPIPRFTLGFRIGTSVAEIARFRLNRSDVGSLLFQELEGRRSVHCRIATLAS